MSIPWYGQFGAVPWEVLRTLASGLSVIHQEVVLPMPQANSSFHKRRK